MTEPVAAPPAAKAISRRRATLINLFFQYATVGLMIVRGVVLAPLYLFFLGDYLAGAWMASGDVLAWITVAEGGVGTVLRQLVAECSGRRDVHALREVIGSGAVMLLVAAGVIACIGLAITPWLPALMEVEGTDARELSRAFLLAIAATAIMIFSSTARATLQGMQMHTGQGVAWVVAESINIAATVALLVAGWGVVSIGLGMLIGQVVSNLMLWTGLVQALRRTRLRPAVSGRRIRAMTPLAAWTFLSMIGDTASKSCDAFLISRFVGNAAVPMAVLSRRLWDILYVVVTRLSFAFQPGLAHLAGEGDRDKFRHVAEQLVRALAVLLAFGAGGVWALNQPFMAVWLPPPGPEVGERFAGHVFNVLMGVAIVLMVVNFSIGQVTLAGGAVRGSAGSQLLPNLTRVALMVGLLAGGRWLGAEARTVVLALPVSAILAYSVLGGLYSFRLWARVLRLSAGELLRQAALLTSRLALAGAMSVLWLRFAPRPEGWLSLVVQAAALAVALVLGLCVLDGWLRLRVRQGLHILRERFA